MVGDFVVLIDVVNHAAAEWRVVEFAHNCGCHI